MFALLLMLSLQRLCYTYHVQDKLKTWQKADVVSVLFKAGYIFVGVERLFLATKCLVKASCCRISSKEMRSRAGTPPEKF